jgi:hypothetical protein
VVGSLVTDDVVERRKTSFPRPGTAQGEEYLTNLYEESGSRLVNLVKAAELISSLDT